MLSVEDLNEIIIALTGLIAAIAGLVAAFRSVHMRIDATNAEVARQAYLSESSSTKVLPPPNP